MEINNLRREKGLKWRLTAEPLTKEYGATLQLRGPMLGDPVNMRSLIALDLTTIASELEEMEIPT